MPAYFVYAPSGRLTQDQKTEVAGIVTRTQSEVTGAALGFMQVLFRDMNPSDVFLGGRPLDGEFLFLHGHVRTMRGGSERAALIRQLVPGIMAAVSMPRHAIWVYLDELPARAMAEYGHILPDPGGEAGWLAALSSEERARVEGHS